MVFQLGKWYELFDPKDNECFIVEAAKKHNHFVLVVKEVIFSDWKVGDLIPINKMNDTWMKYFTITEYTPKIRPELWSLYIDMALQTKDREWFQELQQNKPQSLLNIKCNTVYNVNR